ncbi:hypothetical protein PR202_ga20853 [Eleusine coracana subsp. coracana]|uniref:LOB domain-containing protein n=1 Tax=Eleusine coracana subsp. coracana TaxID=191504 RepID=A0AAV5CZV3_ELECO|nr:hypothetical protein PR202_ga20853 [Eleusine coracana subsp. coracana]
MISSSSSAGTAASHAPHLLHISTTSTHQFNNHSIHSPSNGGGGGGSSSSVACAGGNNNGTSSTSTNQACAACKYQRRKCNPDCPLAPYFPADQQRRFLHAHRLFGVSNILKTLRRLRPEMCADAMGSLIFQAEMRAQDPVGGCYRLILGLERQLEMERAELAAILHHLALCRHQAAMPPAHQQPDDFVDEVIHQTEDQHHAHEDDQGGGGHHSPQQEDQQHLFDYFYYDTTAGDEDAAISSGNKPVTLDINVDAMHHQFDFDDDDHKVDNINVHDEEEEQQHHQLDHGDYDMKAAPLLVDVFDDMRQQAVDVHDADHYDIKAAVDVNNPNTNIDINAVVDVNAEVDLNQELRENNIAAATCEAPHQMPAVESSQCRLGLTFSAL